MTVKKKNSNTIDLREKMDEHLTNEIINRGGKTSADESIFIDSKEHKEFRFTLRISEDLIKKIDMDRRSRVGNISRNQWILETIHKALKKIVSI